MSLQIKYSIFALLITLSLLHFSQEASQENGGTGGTSRTMENLKHWENKEEKIYETLKLKLRFLSKELNLIQKYIKDYESSSAKAFNSVPTNERGKFVGSSAILSHLMTHRYALIITQFRDLRQSKEYLNLKEEISQVLEIQDKSDWLDSNNLHMSNAAITNLQKVYNLPSNQIYQGGKFETDFGGKLDSGHCADLGMFSLAHGFMSRAIEWFELAFHLSGTNPKQKYDKSLVIRLLDAAVMEHNLYANDPLSSAQTLLKPTYPFQPNSERSQTKFEAFIKTTGGKYGNDSHKISNMILLCRGEKIQPEVIRSKMKCFYKNGGHPYLTLNPLKIEQLSEYPKILEIHDVLGQSLIERFHATRNITFSDGKEYDTFRDGLPARFLTGDVVDQIFVEGVAKKSDLIFGKNGLEDLQAVEYIYGQQIMPHKDVYPVVTKVDGGDYEEHDAEGDWVNDRGRVVTILYYMNSPVSGGATVFCDAGITVTPKAGSAVLWYNLFRNGSLRGDTNHASCPIIHGNKIVLNQWIQYKPHFKDFKCSLDPFQ